jgi:hypothetical protein
MSRNGSGTYTLPAGNPVVTGTTIASTWANNTMTDLATALTGSLASDGQTTATGNLKMGNNRVTGMADGIASTDAASITQVTSAVAITGGTINGTTIGATTRSTVKATTLDLGLAAQSVAIGQGDSSSIKNRIINGAMAINQRGASVTSSGYTVDRFQYIASVGSKGTLAQNTSIYPAGFNYSLGFTSSSAYSVGASELFAINQTIEGYNIADLGWGTANAKTVTLSFWVRSSLTGTFGGSLSSYASTRSYPFTYTISSANTWEQKSITVAGDTTGTWYIDNNAGMNVWFGLGVGSTNSGTAGTWAGTAYYSATGATSVVGTSGATFYITGVQLEVGSQATGFEYRQYGTELALCQRYYIGLQTVASPNVELVIAGAMTGATNWTQYMPYAMRTAPTVNFPTSGVIRQGGGTYDVSAWTASVFGTNPQGFYLAAITSSSITANSAAHFYSFQQIANLSAEL